MLCSWSCKPSGVEPRSQGGSCTKLVPVPRGTHRGHLFHGFKKPPVLGADFLRLGKRARTLCIEKPKVAVLSALEMVTSKIESTLHAAALCKMADRGQITGGEIDGPLAFDNAISVHAAKAKKIASSVAGRADILLVPDLEAGNMMAKQLQYLAGADAAGIVLGTRVPVVLTSRADTVRTRLASTAVMVLVAHAKRAPGIR